MSSSSAASPKHPLPIVALKERTFLFYTVARFFSGAGTNMLQAIMLWQVYQISGSALKLGILGLVRLVPALALSLVGGAVADTYNRRNIVMAAQAVPAACGVVLAVATFGHWVSIDLIYGLVLLVAFAGAFEAPARQALLPAIVKPETFASAVVVDSNFQTLGSVTGPAIAGGIIAFGGAAPAYVAFVVSACASILLLAFIHYHQVGSARRINVEMIREGLSFVFARQAILGAMSLDLFAVIFGGAVALFPIFATDILHAGAVGYGLLLAAPDAGGVVVSLLLVLRPPIRRTGRTLFLTMLSFGVWTMVFGLSRNLPLSLAALVLVGASDQVNVVMRRTIIQLDTPDELRGRVSAVSQVFIGASNHVGAAESGFVAAATSATFAVVSGGAGTLAVVGAIRALAPRLWTHEAKTTYQAVAPGPAADAATTAEASAPAG